MSTFPENESILSRLQAWAAADPDKLAFAILDGRAEIESKLTFGELWQRSLQAGSWMLQRVNPGDRVALVLPTSIDFVLAYYGCLQAGVLPVPLSRPGRRHGSALLQGILLDSGARLCLASETHTSKLSEEIGPLLADRLQVVAFGEELIRSLSAFSPRAAAADAAAFLQYTSGSTSNPKGVVVTHRNIMANSAMIADVLGHHRETVQVTWMPLFHDMGLVNHVLQPVYNGTTSFLMEPALFVQRPRVWLEAIHRYRVTSTGGPNFCYDHCARRVRPEQLTGFDFRCWEVAFNGAEPIRPSTIEGFSALCGPHGFSDSAWLPCYGLAEGTLIVTGIRHGEGWRTQHVSRKGLEAGRFESPSNREDTLAVPSVGPPAPRVSLRIVDVVSDTLQPDGGVGEIWAGGDAITAGYWGKVEATRESFVERDGIRFLRTGDLGVLFRGELYITGRLKDLIIIDGKNHYPQDLEATAQGIDALLRADCGAAFSVSVDMGPESVVLVQEIDRRLRRDAPEGVLAELQKKIRSAILDRHGISLEEVVLIAANTLPKTTSGKVQRRRVRDLYREGALDVVA